MGLPTCYLHAGTSSHRTEYSGQIEQLHSSHYHSLSLSLHSSCRSLGSALTNDNTQHAPTALSPKIHLIFALHSNELMNFRVESCWSALRSHPFLAHHQPHTRTHSCLFSCTGFFYGSGIVLVELLLLDSPLTSHIVVVVVHVVAPFSGAVAPAAVAVVVVW